MCRFDQLFSHFIAGLGVQFVLKFLHLSSHSSLFVAQLLSFPLSASGKLPWADQPILHALCNFLASLSCIKRLLHDPVFSTVACFSAIVWVCGLLACAIWVGRAFVRESLVVLWPIKVCACCSLGAAHIMFDHDHEADGLKFFNTSSGRCCL